MFLWELILSFNLLHSEQPKLHRVLAVLSAVGLIVVCHLEDCRSDNGRGAFCTTLVASL